MILSCLIISIMLYGSAKAQIRVELQCRSDLFYASLDSAKKQVGVKEKTGRNDGYKIRLYLASIGLKEGYPYCMAGQYWCFKVSASALLLPSSFIPIDRTGTANVMFNSASKKGKRTKYEANLGDLIIWKYGNSISGHVERIFNEKRAGWVDCVGFNTSNGKIGSQREGNGVFITERNIYSPIGRMQIRGLVGFKLMKS